MEDARRGAKRFTYSNEKPTNKPNIPETLFKTVVGKTLKIILLNGITLIGTVEENVTYDILVKSQGRRIIIPKHAIAYAEEI